MENIIGLKELELRERADVYIREAARGKSFLVMRRSRPVFRITPPAEAPELRETVVDLTKVKKGGVSLRELLKRLRGVDQKKGNCYYRFYADSQSTHQAGENPAQI